MADILKFPSRPDPASLTADEIRKELVELLFDESLDEERLRAYYRACVEVSSKFRSD